MSLTRKFFDWLLHSKPRRRIVQTGKNAGIAKVLIRGEQDHAGMGIVIDPWHMITCAHVVNGALRRELDDTSKPEAIVHITFPMIADPAEYRATIEAWRPTGLMPQDDITVLRFECEAPAAVGVAIPADVTGVPLDDDDLSIFGLFTGQRLGNHVDAKFKGSTSAAWVQLDGIYTDPFVEEGFSGAAVWDHQHTATLGMVVAGRVTPSQRVAYMIPTVELNEFWPYLQIEHRPLSSMFARTWTVASTIYFLSLFAHFAWDRGVQAFAPVTISGDHKTLAAFWGMIIYAFFSPLILGMLIRFSKSFRLHNWIARVPSFGRFGLRPVSSNTWRTAAAGLMAFVILPLAAQVHFIKRFHENGIIYVYPSSFGYRSDDPVFSKEQCYKEGVHLCTKAEAGRYSLAEPRLGFDGDYWSNAYHYGDRDSGQGGTVTFFPIFEPVLILVLTGVSAALSVVALILVFRPTPERRLRRASKAASSLNACQHSEASHSHEG